MSRAITNDSSARVVTFFRDPNHLSFFSQDGASAAGQMQPNWLFLTGHEVPEEVFDTSFAYAQIFLLRGDKEDEVPEKDKRLGG